MKLTLTQSENLKIGQRGEYVPKPDSTLSRRLKRLDIKCWVKKEKAKITEGDKILESFIGIHGGYSLTYGITYKGAHYDCGDMPRDISKFTQGFELALFLK